MNLQLKAFLIAAPLAILIHTIFGLFGLMIFGDKLNLILVGVIGCITGVVVYLNVLKQLQRKSEDSGDT